MRYHVRSMSISPFTMIITFQKCYDLKYDLKNAILNINEDAMKKVIASVQDAMGTESFQTQKSTSSGVVEFYSDKFDGKK